MIINLLTLPFGHSQLKQDVAFSGEQAEAADFKGPVECSAEVDRMQSQIILQVTYTASVGFECARCLKDFVEHLSGSFGVLIEHKSSSSKTDDDTSGKADAYFTDEDDEVDVRQAVYDEVLTSFSQRPLCSPDCSGIQMARWNQADCEETIDPRWEKLKKLRNKKE